MSRARRRSATTTAPPPADPSNRVADDPAARALRPAAVLRPGVLGPPARGRQRRHAGTLGPRRARPARSSCAGCHLPEHRLRRHAQPAPAGLAGGAVDDCGARRRCSRSRSRRSTTGTAGATRSGTRRSASWRATASSTAGGCSSPSSSSACTAPSTRRCSARCRRSTTPTRFPALAPRDRRLRRGGHAEGLDVRLPRHPGRRRRLRRRWRPADQTLVTTVTVNAAKAIAAYVRQLRCGAGPLRSLARRRRGGARPRRAARRGAVRRARRAASPATAGPRLTDGAFHNVGLAPGHRRRRDPGPRRSRRRGGRRRRAHRSAEHARAPSATATAGALPAGAWRRAGGRVPHADAALRCLAPELHAHRPAHLAGAGRRVLRSRRRSGGRLPGHERAHALGLTERERADLVAFLGALAGPGPDAALLVAP